MPNKKHYIITSITLGLIAAASGALIGLANLATKNKIAQNEEDSINAGIVSIFDDSYSIFDKEEVKDDTCIKTIYYVGVEKYEGYALAFRTTASNMYGKISLLVGFTKATDLGESHLEYAIFNGVSIITNEQTYASTLVKNYIDPLNQGDRELDDVKCDATYGATTVRDMINEAEKAAKAKWNIL